MFRNFCDHEGGWVLTPDSVEKKSKLKLIQFPVLIWVTVEERCILVGYTLVCKAMINNLSVFSQGKEGKVVLSSWCAPKSFCVILQ